MGGPLRLPEDDRAFATRLSRYCARNPVALERLTYDRAAKAVTYRSDKADGPTAGTETVDPLEFLARVLVHIPRQRTRHDAILWLVCQPPPRHAGEGGARRRGRAARDRSRPTAGADRGHPPMGGPPAAAL
ncbi:transposase [Gemmatimonas sp.]|uniref:transposase n=1 Tax=Gemmatimonas sp. TaxID=1962908 RepID=UPI0037C105A2